MASRRVAAVLLASYRQLSQLSLPGCQPERRSVIVAKAPNRKKAQIYRGAGVDARLACQVDSHRHVFMFVCKLRLKPGGPTVLPGLWPFCYCSLEKCPECL